MNITRESREKLSLARLKNNLLDIVISESSLLSSAMLTQYAIE
jgi:hypothetical protein